MWALRGEFAPRTITLRRAASARCSRHLELCLRALRSRDFPSAFSPNPDAPDSPCCEAASGRISAENPLELGGPNFLTHLVDPLRAPWCQATPDPTLVAPPPCVRRRLEAIPDGPLAAWSAGHQSLTPARCHRPAANG